jgi:hypothetical protein
VSLITLYVPFPALSFHLFWKKNEQTGIGNTQNAIRDREKTLQNQLTRNRWHN